MDSASEKRLSKVHPLLAERVRKLVGLTALDIRVVQGLRSYAEQDALYAQGRTKPGGKVTNARGGFSNHNFGLAVDLCPFVDDKPDWNDNAKFNEIGKYVHEMGGLEWGGDWKFVDKPHVQLPGLTVSLCRSLYDRGGLQAVWNAASRVNVMAEDNDFGSSVSHVGGNLWEKERDLKFGDKGSDVRALQVKLGAAVDGDFGKSTKAAVIEFQKANGLTVDGVVGKNTRQKLGL